jgi:preprotein translocase subunit YajC
MGALVFQLLPFLLIFGVFYFLIIMPQRKRQQQLQAMIAALKAGDRVVTSGGIIATVTAVREASLIVRSADKTMLEISRAAVTGLHGEEEKK